MNNPVVVERELLERVLEYIPNHGTDPISGVERLEPEELEIRAILAALSAVTAERDRLREALKKIAEADWSSSETATDFAISQTKGLLIGKMKRIARAALQGENE